MYGYLYAFDYSTPSICEIELEEYHSKMTPDEILREYGLNDDECYWMFTNEPLVVNKLIKQKK